jgi:hypothetical protein
VRTSTFGIDSVLGAFFALARVVRGGPVLLLMRGGLSIRQRWQLLLLSSTTLPLLVAVTDIVVRDGHMLPANALTIDRIRTVTRSCISVTLGA